MTARHDDRHLIQRILGPSDPEVGCDECFELLDQYVDIEAAGQNPGDRLPGMRAHLDGCPVCREEYESLRDLVARERD